YDIFGPAVNLAARMERRSEPMQVTVCPPMVELLRDDFNLLEKGEEEIKGFGKLPLFSLIAPKPGRIDIY
ncbi:MAG: adenylate/guanylate cyclase domain-containing protein, partial [Rhodospirillales bacterium]|nr:adenylate/guanylate cyclase domain-containing protein [Rhodospirillales bacterium]